MTRRAPLRVTVEIELHSGPAAGQRRWRLSRALELPVALLLDGELPLEGEGVGRVALTLPDGTHLAAAAELRFDPEHPEHGVVAELRGLTPEAQQAIIGYIEQRTTEEP